LAWERTPARAQNAFAEEFLSHWLGSAEGDSVTVGSGVAPLAMPADFAA
jgi:hypothetical protein